MFCSVPVEPVVAATRPTTCRSFKTVDPALARRAEVPPCARRRGQALPSITQKVGKTQHREGVRQRLQAALVLDGEQAASAIWHQLLTNPSGRWTSGAAAP